MTDNTNKIVSKIILSAGEPIEDFVIEVDKLLKIVKLTTKETIEIVLKEDHIIFKGNGNHKIPIILDDAKKKVKLDMSIPEVDEKELKPLCINDFKKVITRNKSSLYTGDGHAEYYQYYQKGNNIITTDSITVATTKATLLEDGGIHPSIIDKIAPLPNDEFKFAKISVDSKIFYNIVSSKTHAMFKWYSMDEFPIELVEPYTKADTTIFTHNIKILKADLLSAIKRQTLFEDVYAIPSVLLTFSNNSVKIEDQAGKTEEELKVKLNIDTEIKLKVSTEMLLKVLRIMDKDITIYICEEALAFQDEHGLIVLSIME
jgi:hypothetical protein